MMVSQRRPRRQEDEDNGRPGDVEGGGRRNLQSADSAGKDFQIVSRLRVRYTLHFSSASHAVKHNYPIIFYKFIGGSY